MSAYVHKVNFCCKDKCITAHFIFCELIYSVIIYLFMYLFINKIIMLIPLQFFLNAAHPPPKKEEVWFRIA